VQSFDEATAVQELGPGRFQGQVSPAWTIGPKPNGGYLLALVGRAVQATSPHPDPLAVSAHFLRAPDPGAVSVEVELLRAGRTVSQLRAELRQDDRVCVAALFTQGTLGDEPVHWDAGVPAAPATPFEDCLRSTGTNPSGVRVALMDQVDLRLDPARSAFTRGEPSGQGVIEGWLALRDERPFDPLALLFAVDAFPPASFDIARTGWVPTLELTCYLRARPAPGPLRIRQAAQLVAGERFDETCWVWDSAGRLTAQATQLAGIRLPA
jgi:acyl-CoA thioesterase